MLGAVGCGLAWCDPPRAGSSRPPVHFGPADELIHRVRQTRFRLASSPTAMTTCSPPRTGGLGIDFDWIITAQQIGSYKPAEANFRALFDRVDMPRRRILHVAQSIFHDHAPAKRLGLTTVWIARCQDRRGSGAMPSGDARPDATYGDMASLAVATTG